MDRQAPCKIEDARGIGTISERKKAFLFEKVEKRIVNHTWPALGFHHGPIEDAESQSFSIGIMIRFLF